MIVWFYLIWNFSLQNTHIKNFDQLWVFYQFVVIIW